MIQNIYTNFILSKQTTNAPPVRGSKQTKTKNQQKQKKKERLSYLFNYLSTPIFLLCYHREDLILLTL